MSVFTTIFFKKIYFIFGCILAICSSNTSVFAEKDISKDDKKTQVSSDEKRDVKQESKKESKIQENEVSKEKPKNESNLKEESKLNKETNKKADASDEETGAKKYKGKPKVIYMVFTDGPSTIERGFKAYFKEKNIPIQYIERDCAGPGNIKKCNRFVEEIKKIKPDLVYTWGTPAALAIAGKIDEPNKDKFLWDIPIISGIIADPIASKIVYDLKDTGRNLTGVNHIPDYDSQVSAMASYLPTKKIAIFYAPADVISPYNVAAIRKACIDRKVEPVEFKYEHIIDGKMDETRLDEAFAEIKAAGIKMVYLPSSNMLNAQSGPVCNSAHKHGLLTYIVSDGMLTKNATPLMGLIAYRVNVGRLMGVKAEQILFENKTTRQIPYDRLEKFSFFIMRKVMLQLGIYPPLMTVNRSSFIATQEEEDIKKAEIEKQRKIEEEKEKKKQQEKESDDKNKKDAVKKDTDDTKSESQEADKHKDTDDTKSEDADKSKDTEGAESKEADKPKDTDNPSSGLTCILIG